MPPHPNPNMYDPEMVQPMRDEMVAMGAEEIMTHDDVDKVMQREGTTLVFVNSVCGCAAGAARPGLRLSLQGEKKPDHVVTVFAGMDTDATSRAREYFKPYRPSSPQIALMKEGQLLKMLQRQDIEGRNPEAVAEALAEAYTEFC